MGGLGHTAKKPEKSVCDHYGNKNILSMLMLKK